MSFSLTKTIIRGVDFMEFLLGVSLTFNIIFGLLLFLIYRFGLKGFKNKIEDYMIENFLDIDNLDISKIEVNKK